MLPSTLISKSLKESDRLFCLQRAAIYHPRTVRQWMLGFNFSAFDCQAERDAAHLQLIRGLGQSEPTFGFATFRAVAGDVVVAA